MKDKVLIWDLPVRVFHWMLASSFAGAYLLAETERLRNIHVMFGYTVLGLVAFRLLWGFAGSRYARFSSFLYRPRDVLAYLRNALRGGAPRYVGHNPAGSLAIWTILALAALTGVTGYATYNEIGGDAAEEIHEFLANAWLVVVGAHIAGVLVSSFLHRENLARAMVTGYKEAQPCEAAGRPAYAVGGLVLAGVLGFWLWTVAPGELPTATLADAGSREVAGLVADDGRADEDDD